MVFANSEYVEKPFDYRRKLLRIFTPKLRGTLIYRQRQISCIVEETSFAASNVIRVPALFISLLCPSPFFESLDEIRAELASWECLHPFRRKARHKHYRHHRIKRIFPSGYRFDFPVDGSNINIQYH
jgi:hypothetical protein